MAVIYAYFTVEKTEAEKGQVTCVRSGSNPVAELGVARAAGFRVTALNNKLGSA